jgi:hypothetical protein
MHKLTFNLFLKQIKGLCESLLLIIFLLVSFICVNAQVEDPIYIKAADSFDNQRFGHDVSISGDFMAVSAYNSELDSLFVDNFNAVYIHKKTSQGDWNQIQKIDIPDDITHAGGFGYSLSMSGDYLAIGCIYDRYVSATVQSGLVYIYKKGADDYWSLKQTLTPLTVTEGDLFGISVDINGNDLVIGSRTSIDLYTLDNDLFNLKKTINNWSQDYFWGHTVKISGKYVASLMYDFMSDEFYVLIYLIEDDWNVFLEKVIDQLKGDFYKGLSNGLVPSISLSESQIAITSFGDNDPFLTGSIFLYEKGDGNNWYLKQEIVPEIEDGSLYFIGNSINITDNYLVTSGSFLNWDQQPESVIWVYKQNEDNYWNQDIYFSSGVNCDNWCRGWAFDVEDQSLAMGSIYDFTDGPLAGQAYIFILNSYTNVSNPHFSLDKLYQNSPNPFRDKTSIGFELGQASFGTIRIFDSSGKIIRIIEGAFKAGYNEITLKDFEVSGVFYYTLMTKDFVSTQRMMRID